MELIEWHERSWYQFDDQSLLGRPIGVLLVFTEIHPRCKCFSLLQCGELQGLRGRVPSVCLPADFESLEPFRNISCKRL